jgi:CheY-like chemotaxis protein
VGATATVAAKLKKRLPMPTRVLVVDDDDWVRFVIRRALEDLGDEFDIATAGSGNDALALFGEGEFDLVITDLRMPGMDGIQLTEAIRDLDPRAVVIWMTAYICHDAEREAVRLGVDMCLEKPLEVGEIRSSVLAALNRADAGVSAGHSGGNCIQDPATGSGE